MATNHTRPPFSGNKTELVISIDIGTTFSGASYTILTPNQVPRIYDVVGFKGQEDQPSSTKVPTVVCYDLQGNLLSCGPEAVEQFGEEDDSCYKVEWFKLHLRPPSLNPDDAIPPITLPRGVTALDVLGHFLKYMQGCVRDYILDSHVDGEKIWNDLGPTARYILTHPNGWSGFQQGQMRDVAVRSGLVPATAEGKNRVEFVTEGEASFHWCVEAELVTTGLAVGSHIVIADCGGGTIDVSAFKVTSLKPLNLEETSAPECRIAGSVIATQAFTETLNELLEESDFGEPEYIARAKKEFDKKTKCLFRDREQPAHIKIGSRRDNDPAVGIRLGNLTVAGSTIAAAFERSCSQTEDAIRIQVQKNSGAQVFLVGGFAASPWLFNELKRRLHGTINDLKRADTHTAKAVAHGALVYLLDHYVTARIHKNTYGVSLNWHYDATQLQHRLREKTAFVDNVTGAKLLGGGFMPIITKGKTVEANATYRASLVRSYPTKRAVSVEMDIDRYTGGYGDIKFYDMDDASSFQKVCTFTTNIPASACIAQNGPRGQFFQVSYDVVITLGTSEMKCFVEWTTKKGKPQKGFTTSAWEDL